ncbi:MAG: type II toxin-antitoxin system HicB family antitoxin [Nitrococcus sp.]|nr:type II toxin-antitoxin system HicB family antitoxin [Nitrococcus sp.]
MLTYPATLLSDTNDTVLVTFPDFPEAATFGADEVDGLGRAVCALEEVIASRMADRSEIPQPSAVGQGQRGVRLSALTAAKVLLYQEMRAQGVRKAELARRLHWHMPQVDRLLDLNHASRLDQIEAALAALGKRLEVTLEAA